jgi:heme-degrading monooxygenase HmoA
MVDSKHPKVMVLIRFKSTLPAEEVERRYKERLPDFQKLPGLLQKYYLHDAASGEWGGMYLWDSQESLDAFMSSDLRKSIPEAYQFADAPRVEVVEVVDVLR